jgi:hypothetical protein
MTPAPDEKKPGAAEGAATRADAQGNHEQRDCGEPLASTPTPEKRFREYQARLALRGHQLHQLADGAFLATRWDLSRALPTLEAVGAFVRLVEGGTR